MTAGAAIADRAAGRARPSRALLAALLALGGATALSVLLWRHPGGAVVPILFAATVWAIWSAPLRTSAGVLIVLLLAVDDSANAGGLWHSPLAVVGDVLRLSVRMFIPQASAIALTGAEIVVAFLLGVAIWRRARRERVPGHVDSPAAITAIGILYVAAIAFGVANGLARGGSAEVVVWQTRPLLVTAALFLVFEAAFRGPADHALLGKIIVLAASARALIAIWVRHVVAPHAAEPVAFATDHGDSMLFSLACVIIVAHLLERPDRKRLETALFFLPLLLLGMQANDRRTGWLQLALALVVFLVVARTARWKRSVSRLALASVPILALYGAAGWNASGGVFEPVRIFRSVIDSRMDSSTWNRQVENWNLAMSMRERPLSGRGFGHEWTEWYRGDEISTTFHRYMTKPHNQVLGLLLFGGGLAFAALWAPFAVLVLLAVRAYPLARTPEDRAAALCVAATAVVVGVQCFSDLGTYFHQYWVLTALALAIGGKLVSATGAWR
jgi:hypothetical protein